MVVRWRRGDPVPSRGVGRTPGPRGSPWTCCLLAENAGQGAGTRSRGSALQESCRASLCVILTDMRFAICCTFLAITLFGSDAYPPPRFTDPDRVHKLEAALPEIDQIFQRYAETRKVPGMVW